MFCLYILISMELSTRAQISSSCQSTTSFNEQSQEKKCVVVKLWSSNFTQLLLNSNVITVLTNSRLGRKNCFFLTFYSLLQCDVLKTRTITELTLTESSAAPGSDLLSPLFHCSLWNRKIKLSKVISLVSLTKKSDLMGNGSLKVICGVKVKYEAFLSLVLTSVSTWWADISYMTYEKAAVFV